jgi:hypothetical protein
MRADVRQHVDIVGATAWLTDAEVDRRLNESLSRLYGQLVVARGEEYYRTSTGGNTTANTATYALPATMLSLLGIDVTISGEVFTIKRIGFEERNRFQNVTGWNQMQQIRYSLEGSNVRFFPTPDGVFPVTIWYVPVFTNLAADDDTFEGYSNWEHWAVVDAAKAVFAHRDRGEPPAARDIRGSRWRDYSGWDMDGY